LPSSLSLSLSLPLPLALPPLSLSLSLSLPSIVNMSERKKENKFTQAVHMVGSKLAKFTSEHVDSNLGITNLLLNDLIHQITSSIAESNKKSRPRFLKVSNLGDMAMNRKTPPCSYIVNLGRQGSEPTGHFVACLDTGDKILYLDSFGQPPPPELLNLWNKEKRRGIFYSNTTIQDITSSHCGMMAAAHVVNFELNNPPEFLKWHTDKNELTKNDQLACSHILELFDSSESEAHM